VVVQEPSGSEVIGEKMRWAALTLFTLVAVLVGMILWRSLAVSSGGGSQDPRSVENSVPSNQSPDPNRPSLSPQRPEEISAIFPEENGAACPETEVSVGFSLAGAMLKDGEVDPTVFSLALDGKDVTAETDIRGTMDFPQSQATLIYRAEKPLRPGRHESAVSFPSKEAGKTQTYVWAFRVQEGPCS
jgi:hypothetical protein